MKGEGNMNKYRFLLYFIAMGLCLISQSVWASRAYVTDTFTVTLRTGPSLQNKILAMLSSGKPLEVLNSKNDWSHVRVLGQKEKNREGWVLSRYLITRTPWESQAGQLKKENALLKEKLAKTEKERNEISQKSKEVSGQLKTNTDALLKTQKDYKYLKKGAAKYLDLKTRYELAESALKTNQDAVKHLTLENEKLKSSKRNTWFASGAMVLLVGLIIGLIMGRRQKKRKSILYG